MLFSGLIEIIWLILSLFILCHNQLNFEISIALSWDHLKLMTSTSITNFCKSSSAAGCLDTATGTAEVSSYEFFKGFLWTNSYCFQRKIDLISMQIVPAGSDKNMSDVNRIGNQF